MVYYDLMKKANPGVDITSRINEVILEIYDSFVVHGIVDKRTGDDFSLYETESMLQVAYDSWYSELVYELCLDYKKIRKIWNVQEELENVIIGDRAPFSPLTITSMITAFRPTLKGNPINPSDGLDTFNESVPSPYVPCITYNDASGKSHVKIIKGSKFDDTPNYSVTISSASDTPKPNTMYFSLWLASEKPEERKYTLENSPKEAFYTAVYSLEFNSLTIESPVNPNPKKGLITDKTISWERIHDSIPTVDFGPGEEVKVKGCFDFWDVEIEEVYFLDMILNQPAMNVYLYSEENIKRAAFKKRLDIHYRNIYSDINEGETFISEAYISNSASVSSKLND